MAKSSEKAVTYLSYLKQNKDEKEAASAISKAQDAKVQLEADLLAAKRNARNAANAFEQAKFATPFDSSDVLSAADDLASAEADVETLQEIKEQLFNDITFD